MRLTALVKDVMRKNIKTIKENDSVKTAARIMKYGDIGSVVVLNKKKEVIGIVTKSDIVYKFVAGEKKTVKQIMTKKLITVSPHEAIDKAAEIMAKYHIEKLLVFDKGKVLGIISATDILKMEPGLHTVLFEMLKRKGSFTKSDEPFFGVCESCGNYSDDLKEVGGLWQCPECRNE